MQEPTPAPEPQAPPEDLKSAPAAAPDLGSGPAPRAARYREVRGLHIPVGLYSVLQVRYAEMEAAFAGRGQRVPYAGLHEFMAFILAFGLDEYTKRLIARSQAILATAQAEAQVEAGAQSPAAAAKAQARAQAAAEADKEPK